MAHARAGGFCVVLSARGSTLRAQPFMQEHAGWTKNACRRHRGAQTIMQYLHLYMSKDKDPLPLAPSSTTEQWQNLPWRNQQEPGKNPP